MRLGVCDKPNSGEAVTLLFLSTVVKKEREGDGDCEFREVTNNEENN